MGHITPVNSAHRAVLMALEKGTLPNLIFDNHSLARQKLGKKRPL